MIKIRITERIRAALESAALVPQQKKSQATLPRRTPLVVSAKAQPQRATVATKRAAAFGQRQQPKQ